MSIIRMRLRLLCTYTFHVGVRKRKPERIISRVSLNRALSVFFRSRGFTQLREPGKSQTVQRFGICEPRETTGASSSSSATSAGRVPRDPWSLRAPRGTRELEFHNAPHPLASCGPRVPALRRGAFPDPRRTRCARSRRMGTPKRRARFTPKPDLSTLGRSPFPSRLQTATAPSSASALPRVHVTKRKLPSPLVSIRAANARAREDELEMAARFLPPQVNTIWLGELRIIPICCAEPDVQ